MAGRGKGMTLPAWMTDGGGPNPSSIVPTQQQQPPPNPLQQPPHMQPPQQYLAPSPIERSRSREKDRSTRKSSRSRSRESSRHSSRRERSQSRDRDRNRDRLSKRRNARDRSMSPDEAPRKWVSRVKNRKSNFDVKPPEGMVLPAIGGLGTSLNPALPVGIDGSLQSGMTHSAATMQQTKHARRIYIGGIGNNTAEKEIESFIRDAIFKAMEPAKPNGNPVLSTYMNKEKCFCFLELNSIELTTACCSLDGISFKGNSLKIRRPNDFRPEAMPTNLPPPPVFNLAALGIVGTTVAEGPGKVFVGGLPYHLTEDEIKELLSAFGPLRSFHLVKDAGAVNSKGYAFCEYADFENTHVACQGLNGLQVGDKTLTVRVSAQSNAPPPPVAPFTFNVNEGGITQHTYQAQVLPPQPISLSDQITTKVLILKNMVTAEELRDDNEFVEICEDVKDECSQHGKVLSVLIPRAKDNYPQQCEGSVFVEFQEPEGAKTAALVLRGRKFAGRMVDVAYYDEIKYSNKILL